MGRKFKTACLKLAGVDLDILKKCPASEHNRLWKIGASIVATSFLAFVSMSYALYQTFFSFIIAIIVGLFWAFVVMIIDSTLVTSLKKTESNNFLSSLWIALPRFTWATIIALIVSKPLEIKILEPQIDRYEFEQVALEMQELKTLFKEVYDVNNIESEVKNINSQLKVLDDQKINVVNDSVYIFLDKQFRNCEYQYNSLEYKIKKLQLIIKDLSSLNPKDLTIAMKDELANSRREMAKHAAKQATLRCTNQLAERDRYFSRKQADIERTIQISARALPNLEKRGQVNLLRYDSISNEALRTLDQEHNSLFGKLVLLEKMKTDTTLFTQKLNSIHVNSGFKLMSGSDGKRNSSLMVWISRFLWLLFWGLETMPLFMKMLSPFGIYDALLERKTKDIILNARNGQL